MRKSKQEIRKKKSKSGNTIVDIFRKKVITKMKNFPLDVYHSFLLASQDMINQKMTELKPSLCPKCLAPYSAGYVRSRLLPRPQKPSSVRTLLRREKRGKASRRDRVLIAALKEKENVFVVRCRKCCYEIYEKLPPRPSVKRKPRPESHSNEQNDDSVDRKSQVEIHSEKKKQKASSGNVQKTLQPTVRESAKTRVKQKDNKIENRKKKKKKSLTLDIANNKSVKSNLAARQTEQQSKHNSKKFKKLHQLLSSNSFSNNNTSSRNLDSFLNTLI